MKYVKMLGLLAVAATALTALTGTASATITSPPGTVYNGEISATSTNIKFTGSVEVACGHSSFSSSFTNGATSGSTTTLTYTECNKDTVKVHLRPKVTIGPDGKFRWELSAEFTLILHRSIFGFPVTTHCVYKPNNDMGTLTEGVSPAVIHINSAPIPQGATDGACGENAIMTGTYTITNPSSAIVVD